VEEKHPRRPLTRPTASTSSRPILDVCVPALKRASPAVVVVAPPSKRGRWAAYFHKKVLVGRLSSWLAAAPVVVWCDRRPSALHSPKRAVLSTLSIATEDEIASGRVEQKEKRWCWRLPKNGLSTSLSVRSGFAGRQEGRRGRKGAAFLSY